MLALEFRLEPPPLFDISIFGAKLKRFYFEPWNARTAGHPVCTSHWNHVSVPLRALCLLHGLRWPRGEPCAAPHHSFGDLALARSLALSPLLPAAPLPFVFSFLVLLP